MLKCNFRKNQKIKKIQKTKTFLNFLKNQIFQKNKKYKKAKNCNFILVFE